MSADVYAAAVRYAERGIAVFPCRANDKRPLTPSGLHDASTDPSVIHAWQRRWRVANIGIPTGVRSGFVVIDLDVKHNANGRATLTAIERDLGALPGTLTSVTPSGGEHRWFRMPDTTIRNAAGSIAGESAPGVDVRGDGGYVVAPPSTIERRAYTWTNRSAPAELPSRWIEALAPARLDVAPVEPWKPRDVRERDRVGAWCERALQYEARALADAAEGTRNDLLWRSAAALGGLVHFGAIGVSDVRAALTWACSRWAQRDMRKDADTIARGIAFGLNHPRVVALASRGAS